MKTTYPYRLNTIGAEELLHTPITPVPFVVEELLTQGLHLLAGAPKIGKSRLALWLCLCVAKGEPMISIASNKDIRVTIRLSPEQYESIKSRADTAHLSISSYIRAAAMRHKVAVIDGLPEMTRELKGLGRNLNQLTVLAHQGHITSPDLSRTASALERCYTELHLLTEQERR